MKPDTLKTWVLNRHMCSQLMQDVAELRCKSNETNVQNCHKEEANARIENDKKDKEAVKNKLELCLHPIKPETHPQNLVNVMNGCFAVQQVNVDMAVTIGYNQLVEFEESLPTGFWKPIERKIKTMVAGKKGITVGPRILYDTELIFSRVIGLEASLGEVDFRDVLSYELAPIPTACLTTQLTIIVIHNFI